MSKSPINDQASHQPRRNHPFLTTGIVVDVSDPQEMGRVRVLCPTLGDPDLEQLESMENVPWASYMSPIAGLTNGITRGPTETTDRGDIAYGFWSIPTIGSQVIVACLDGDVQMRIWMGCLYETGSTHTMPHGRFFANSSSVDGPGTSAERPINSLRRSLKEAFGNSYEFISRGADYTVSALHPDLVLTAQSSVADDKNKRIELPSGTIIEYTQGYSDIPRDPTMSDTRESQTSSWVTPGFHAISMDDRKDNCRIRIRTTMGHQIILDDTNERVLINTSGGRAWIEMDAIGNIDMYAERHLAIHSIKDMSFTTDGKMRFAAQQGFHFSTPKDFRVSTGEDINLRSQQNIRIKTLQNTLIDSDQQISIKSTQDMKLESTATFNIKGGPATNIQATTTVNISAGGSILQTAGAIHLNGPTAAPAQPADSSNAAFAFTTNRVPFRLNPQGEAWSRGMLSPSKTDDDKQFNFVDYYNYSNFQVPYNDLSVGRVELSDIIARNPYWRR